MSGIRPATPGTLEEPRIAQPTPGPKKSTWHRPLPSTPPDMAGMTANDHVVHAAAGLRDKGVRNGTAKARGAVACIQAEILHAMREP